MGNPALAIPASELEQFCRRWKVRTLALFGSALRDDFRPESDVDLLARFEPDADWSVIDHIQMEEELTALFGREAQIVSWRAVEQSRNWVRRKHILETARTIYAA